MKNNTKSVLFLSVTLVTFMSLFSCSNADSVDSGTTAKGLHSYGLNPMESSEWANVPNYRTARPTSRVGSTAEVLPSSCLLLNPGIRDQGQIGSCTGFCGTETNEILKYYAANA